MANSLVRRITLWSIAWITLVLVATALVLVYFYRDHSEAYYDVHVQSHLDELVDSTTLSPDGELSLRSLPSDPNFQRRRSGWYWEVRHDGDTVARSESLEDGHLNFAEEPPGEDVFVLEASGPDGQPLRVHGALRQPSGARSPITYLASAPVVHVSEDVRNFTGHIVYSFLALGLGFIIAVVIQIRMSLRPLDALGRAIEAVEKGERQSLPDDFPREIQPLADELNHLISHNKQVLSRARDRVGDLAHALKNPLAIIKNEVNNLPDAQRELIRRQVEAMSGDVENYLVRARSSGQVNPLGAKTRVDPILEDLEFALRHIHGPAAGQWEKVDTGKAIFLGEAEDLEEMLGNILDNASKWAAGQVRISCRSSNGRIQITVEDDGPGIPDELRARALQRGVRLDEGKPGHGLGLSIAKELAELYGGSLALEPSTLGGLKVTLDLPGTT